MAKISKNNIIRSSRVKEYLDIDYFDDLSPEDREYLQRFLSEYYSASFLFRPTFIVENNELICIKGNINSSDDRDLRKYRSSTRFFLKETGTFSSNPNDRFSINNIHSTKDEMQKCTDFSVKNSRDLSTRITDRYNDLYSLEENFSYCLEDIWIQELDDQRQSR